MAITIYSAQLQGLSGRPISVEVDVAPGLHLFSIVGLADKEVQESRERISAAIKNIGALAPHKKSQRVIVNLAPADIKKEGPAFDLPIALGYLLASGQIAFDPRGKLFLGELSLDGKLRKISGVLPLSLAAASAGFNELIVPKGNGVEASLAPDISVREAGGLGEVIDYLAGRVRLEALPKTTLPPLPENQKIDLRDIRGQEKAKRALEIAAAGGHHLFFSGPPGAGKTILAEALSSILPPFSTEEMLEVTKIYSIAGLLSDECPYLGERPFRNPHHTASFSAVIGGGSSPRPGEVTLAHRGVLFLDEFPEFDRRVMESLRQPLEARTITVLRAHGIETFPANFLLVVAMNPCPCGNYGNPKQDCSCSPGAIHRYRRKISGPILDRIDLHIEVPPVEYEKLEGSDAEASRAVRQRVARARAIQAARFQNSAVRTNAEMGLRELKSYLEIRDTLKPLLKLAHERHRLSARAYHRVLKLSRTIADLEGRADIEEHHILEALQYRPKVEL